MKVNQEIVRKAINHFGALNQKIKACEELSELVVAITKDIVNPKKTKEDIITEIADVYIMLKQLFIIYDIPDILVKDEIDFKLTRLRAGLKGGVK